MRVRGLKLAQLVGRFGYFESHPMRVRGLKRTLLAMLLPTLMSHPMRVRGLKPCNNRFGRKASAVAPHAGAWIETISLKYILRFGESHPMRVRGLKQENYPLYQNQTKSHPMRVRGLKRSTLIAYFPIPLVAPHAGAWIETSRSGFEYLYRVCRTPCGCVD